MGNIMHKMSPFLLALILFLLQVSLAINITSASPATQVSITNPLTGDNNFIFYTDTVSVGYQFKAVFYISDVVNMALWQVSVQFNPSHIECLNISIPTENIFKGKVIIAPDPVIDNTAGSMVYGATVFPMVGVSGSGVLCEAWFKIKAAPSPGQTLTSTIQLITEDTFTTKLEDPNGNPIPFTPQHATYQYISTAMPPTAKIRVQPSSIVNASLTPCTNFTININVENVYQLNSLNFTLKYNPSILSASKAEPGAFLPSSTIIQVEIDNAEGLLHFQTTIPPPENPPSGDGTIAIITLHVEGLGSTNLTLIQTILKDPQGNVMTHIVENGYFNNKLLPGDLNGDGKVDMTDVGIMIRVFGSRPNDPRWNPEADLNQDNKIDLKDVGLLLRFFAKTK